MMEIVHRLFNNETARRVLVKLRLVLGLASIAAMAYFLMKREWFWPGLAVSAFGAVMQWWCFSCIMTSKELATNGPYVFVRNPMYLSRFFLVLGGVIMTGNLWLIAALVVVYHLYMVNRVRREEKKLAGIFGAPYEEYCRTVPRFVPSFTKRSAGKPLFFSWTCFQRNSGVVNIIAVLAVYAALIVWWWYA
jgi:protein-S-isoprenylcysteine O-methyltransferase Ste14